MSGKPASPGALIVGGAHVSIAIARSLGRQGVPVWLMANHPIPKFSRYVERSFPWPGADHANGVSSIIDVATRYGLKDWVLIAAGDQDMQMIAKNHAQLSAHFRVATPDWNTIQWIYDKRFTYQRAAELASISPGASSRKAWTRWRASSAVSRSFSSRRSARAPTSSRNPRPGRPMTATPCSRSTSAPPRWSAAMR